MNYFRDFRAPSEFAQKYLLFSDGMGHLKSEDFFIDRELFNNNLIMVVISGKLHVEQNRHYILRAGEGIIMRLYDRHKYYTDPTDICEILWLHFNGPQCEPLLNYIEEKYKMPAIFIESSIGKLIRKCFLLVDDPIHTKEISTSQAIYTMITNIVHSLSKSNYHSRKCQKTEFMDNAMEYIYRNIYQKIQLRQFSEAMNLSPFHFCRIFESYFHMSPMKFFNYKKIEMAKYFLAYTNDSIAVIAQNLGFADQSHFTKVFKVTEKETPLSFRKNSAKNLK